MMNQERMNPDAEQVCQLLLAWANATRTGARDAILQGHDPDALIYDVLPPLLYHGTDAYRAGWGDWQPQTQGDDVFEFTALNVVAGADVAFACGLIKCGGILVDGRTFDDLVRATFCLQKRADAWLVTHQHISKPAGG
ncbi:nuclear transport factor 2 family protein [Massilia sp. G4R7]|uniref:Nuclear transport factor 2 family protein n=1 Tax=Massilia phyllostachyos TaxID=2898585 RepID=A0ABS8Q5M2_9BURK|nr:nuclear transport factor 2 family protein [Massilia phyllostachyos]MCD2516894.1 nuclear transport factor 2 family protein [Massilia phyllostachyos]